MFRQLTSSCLSNYDLHTQQLQSALNDRARISILNNRREKAEVNNIILPNELLRNRLEDVQLVETDIGGQPLSTGEKIGLEVKAMERSGGGNFVAEVDEPDAGDMSAFALDRDIFRCFKLRFLFKGILYPVPAPTSAI